MAKKTSFAFGNSKAMTYVAVSCTVAIPFVVFMTSSGRTPNPEPLFGVGARQDFANLTVRKVDTTLSRIITSRKLRGEVVQAAELAILADLAALARSVDAAKFAESALGWESTSNWMQGRGIHRSWLEQSFRELVASPDDARDIITLRLKAMQEALREINDAMFEAEGMDSSQMRRPFPLTVDMSPAWHDCNVAIDKAQEAGEFAPVETVGNFVVSSLIGMAAESAVRSLGPTDADGNLGTTSRGAATAAGLGAGIASDMITTELIGSERNLTQAVNSIVSHALANMQKGGRHSSIWELPMLECALYERTKTEDAIVRKHGRPLSVALQSLK